MVKKLKQRKLLLDKVLTNLKLEKGSKTLPFFYALKKETLE